MPKNRTSSRAPLEICILAGGLSSRMGRDKARLRLGRRTVLGHICEAARRAGFPVRIIRRDLVPHSGPLTGIYTGLVTTRAEAVLFVACDMPFVSAGTLQRLSKKRGRAGAVFTNHRGRVGFPFLIARAALPQVQEQLAKEDFSLQSLAKTLAGREFRLPGKAACELVNVNTPADWALAQELFRQKG